MPDSWQAGYLACLLFAYTGRHQRRKLPSARRCTIAPFQCAQRSASKTETSFDSTLHLTSSKEVSVFDASRILGSEPAVSLRYSKEMKTSFEEVKWNVDEKDVFISLRRCKKGCGRYSKTAENSTFFANTVGVTIRTDRTT